MSNAVTIPANFGAVSNVFGGSEAPNDELGAGVSSSYGIIGYKGKVWSIRHQGNEHVLMRDDGDGPRNSIEVVLVKASPAISKIFYKRGYVEGSNEAPDCWSANGQTPDASVQNKVNPTCADCPMNAWGSRVTEAGKQGKACTDSRRVAVVPLLDIENELFGGPMLLRIPAASLKDLKMYGDTLNGYSYPYYAVATRVAFDAKEAYPKFVFSAIRPLSDDEATKVVKLREDADKKLSTVLSEKLEGAAPTAEPAKEVPASPFEAGFDPKAAQPAQTQPAQAQPAQTQAAQTQPAAEPVTPEVTNTPQTAQPAQETPKNPFGNMAPAQDVQPAATTQQAEPAQAQPAQTQQAQAQPEQKNQEEPAPSATGVASFDDLLDQMLP